MKLSVVNAAFVMPRRTGFPSAGLPSFFKTRSFSSSNTILLTWLPGKNSVSPGSSIRTLRNI